MLAVRATVNLRGMPAGRVALVDPNDWYIAELIDNGYLHPLPPDEQPKDDEASP